MIRRLILLVVAALLLLPVAAAAQETNANENDDVLFRVNGPITVAAGETLDSVIGISNDVVVDGVVNDTLVVIDGNATVNGRVDGDIVVMSGKLTLGPTAMVKNVSMLDSDLVRDPAATVTGDLNENIDISYSFWDSFFFSFVMWLGMTAVVLVAGLIFAFFGSKQLISLAETARKRLGESIAMALGLFFILPMIAVAAMITLVGIPLGVAILLFMIPALWFVGYLIIGTDLGMWIRSLFGRTQSGGSTVWSTLIGLFTLQLITLIPFLGPFIAFLCGLLGSGVLVYHLIQGRRGKVHPATTGAAAPIPAD